MRPFFRYYGSKARLAKHYGQPRRDLVIEPFAGSACYSLYWNCRNVKLYDIDDEVCCLWDYLINCSEQDVRNLPDWVESNEQLFQYSYAEERLLARWIWFGIGGNPPTSRKSQMKLYKGFVLWAKGLDPDWKYGKKNPYFWGPRIKERIIKQKPLIANWTIDNRSYEDIPDCNAHYHVDPPYNSKAGKGYRYSDIDYKHLGEWCRSRQGVVDVCEMEGADWMDFKPLSYAINVDLSKYTEVYWSSDNLGRLI